MRSPLDSIEACCLVLHSCAHQKVTCVQLISASHACSDCGQWQWTPGGQRQKPRWVGPTFTLSTSLGTCALLAPGTGPNVIGQGSPTWTSVQLARLACQGPSVQYGFVSKRHAAAALAERCLVC